LVFGEWSRKESKQKQFDRFIRDQQLHFGVIYLENFHLKIAVRRSSPEQEQKTKENKSHKAEKFKQTIESRNSTRSNLKID
jgi:hypothetical protein